MSNGSRGRPSRRSISFPSSATAGAVRIETRRSSTSRSGIWRSRSKRRARKVGSDGLNGSIVRMAWKILSRVA